jgi:hypothetical protein
LRRDLLGRRTFKRALQAVADGTVPAAEVARQLGDVLSEVEVKYLAERLSAWAWFELLPDMIGGDVRLAGPKAPVGHRAPEGRVARKTVLVAAAALEERLLAVLPREPIHTQRRGRRATISAAIHVTPSAISHAVRRTLRAIGLEGIPRSGVRQARSSAPNGPTKVEREAWQKRQVQRDAWAGRKRKQRLDPDAAHRRSRSASELVTEAQRAAAHEAARQTGAYRRERLERTARRKLRAGIVDSETYLRIVARVMGEPTLDGEA